MLGCIEKTDVRRIHIVGGPGSGKTVLARHLGSMLNIPTYELDKIAFEGVDFNERSRTARLADVHHIAVQPTWITEGIFLGWTNELMVHADLIVWLDCVSWRIAMQRISVRFIQGGVSEAKRQDGIRKFTRFRDYARNMRQLVGVFFSSRRYYAASTPVLIDGDFMDSRNATIKQLGPYKMKVFHCQTSNDVRALLKTIKTRPMVSHILPS